MVARKSLLRKYYVATYSCSLATIEKSLFSLKKFEKNREKEQNYDQLIIRGFPQIFVAVVLEVLLVCAVDFYRFD